MTASALAASPAPVTMKIKTGRPEEFNESEQKTFVGLVEVGLSRRQAAIYLGFSPSTVTKRAARDPVLATRLRQAELQREYGLLSKMVHQSDRSWRAAAWLLERIHPERYAKGKLAAAQPSLDEIFDRVSAIVAEVVPDAAVRAELESRLSRLAAAEFEDVACPLVEPCEFESPEEFEPSLDETAQIEPISVSALMQKSADHFRQAQDEQTWDRMMEKKRAIKRRKRLLREFHDAGRHCKTLPSAAAFLASEAAASLDGNSLASEAARHDAPLQPQQHFFNTSPVPRSC